MRLFKLIWRFEMSVYYYYYYFHFSTFFSADAHYLCFLHIYPHTILQVTVAYFTQNNGRLSAVFRKVLSLDIKIQKHQQRKMLISCVQIVLLLPPYKSRSLRSLSNCLPVSIMRWSSLFHSSAMRCLSSLTPW